MEDLASTASFHRGWNGKLSSGPTTFTPFLMRTLMHWLLEQNSPGRGCACLAVAPTAGAGAVTALGLWTSRQKAFRTDGAKTGPSAMMMLLLTTTRLKNSLAWRAVRKVFTTLRAERTFFRLSIRAAANGWLREALKNSASKSGQSLWPS